MKIWQNITQALGLFAVIKSGEDLERAKQQAQENDEQSQFCSNCGYPKSSPMHQKACG